MGINKPALLSLALFWAWSDSTPAQMCPDSSINKQLRESVVEKKIITSPQQFAEYFKLGEHSNISAKNVAGRILRGKTDAEFNKLSPNSDRKIIMLLDGDGLNDLTGLEGREVLVKLGYTERDIKEYLASGTRFKLAFFDKSADTKPATWDNLVELMKKAWPNSTAVKKVERQIENLKRFSGPDGYKKIIPKSALINREKMTLEKLEQSRGELWQVRLFLHDQLNLNELYMGDGYTYNIGDDGVLKKGVREYFNLNQEIDELPNNVVIDLPIAP